MADIKIRFDWTNFRPDQRTYRQNSFELFPVLGVDDGRTSPQVEIGIPLKGEYLANCEEIITKQLSGQPAPNPVLTIKGLRFVADAFDEIFYSTEEDEKPAEAPKAKVEDDWESDWSENKIAAPATQPDKVQNAEDDSWAESGDDNTDAPWNEKDEDWG